MQPIGPLMHEHRLIERLLRLVEREIGEIEAGKLPDCAFLGEAVDFFRTYADRCHHGKEEDILFRELAKKPLSDEERRIMADLTEEHALGRNLVRSISEAVINMAFLDEQAAVVVLLPLLRRLVGFYPEHIAKEDKAFFFPVMRHFSRREMDDMLAEFAEFDRRLIHDKYAWLVESRE